MNIKNFIFSIMSLVILLSSCKNDGDGINDTPEPYTVPETPVEWVLDFEDNFEGTSLDENVWGIYDNAWSDDPAHMRRREAVQVKDGLLTLLVATHPVDPERYMTGGIAHNKNYMYGKFEFRVRIDQDPANATSGVCLTWPESEEWPKDGEMDIYETEYDGNFFNTWIHYGVKGSDGVYYDNKYQQTHRVDKSQWHIIALEWSPEYAKIYIDGELHWNLKDPEAIASSPHHVCFQTEKGSDAALAGPVKMQVDWVKVYNRVEI
ncbi:MAG: glycoside hydrolase family 16 protein [Draconibacterium sp.]